jgi:hypothetical protein
VLNIEFLSTLGLIGQITILRTGSGFRAEIGSELCFKVPAVRDILWRKVFSDKITVKEISNPESDAPKNNYGSGYKTVEQHKDD